MYRRYRRNVIFCQYLPRCGALLQYQFVVKTRVYHPITAISIWSFNMFPLCITYRAYCIVGSKDYGDQLH